MFEFRQLLRGEMDAHWMHDDDVESVHPIRCKSTVRTPLYPLTCSRYSTGRAHVTPVAGVITHARWNT